MSVFEDFEEYEENDRQITDPIELVAKEEVREFFEAHQTDVFFSRQIEVLL